MDMHGLSPNKQLVASFFALLQEDKLVEMFALIDADCRIWNPNAHYTKAEFVAVASAMTSQTSGPFRVEIVGMTEEGDRVAIETRNAVPLRNGNRYENNYHWLFVIRDGRFTEMREYTDTWPARVAFQRH